MLIYGNSDHYSVCYFDFFGGLYGSGVPSLIGGASTKVKTMLGFSVSAQTEGAHIPDKATEIMNIQVKLFMISPNKFRIHVLTRLV